jgi:hypothetical protein
MNYSPLTELPPQKAVMNGTSGRCAEFAGTCKMPGCRTTVTGRTAAEAITAAMEHGQQEHGDPHLGMRWGSLGNR